MLCELGNHLLMFGIILSNCATVVYVYPIFLGFIEKYELKNEYSTLIIIKYLSYLFISYELPKSLANYFWIKISNNIGVPICINISLLFLTLTNLSFSYTTGIYSAMLIRAVTGTFNNLSTLSKIYILQIFKAQDHADVVKVSAFLMKFSTILGFLIGGFLYVSNDDLVPLNTGGFSFGLNKFFLASWLMSTISFITLISNLFKFRLGLKVANRFSQIHEKVEIQIETCQDDKKIEEDRFTIKSCQSKKPSLVLYDCSSKKDNYSGKNLDQIMDKDYNCEEYSRRSKKSLDNSNKDRSYFVNRDQLDYFKTEVLETNKSIEDYEEGNKNREQYQKTNENNNSENKNKPNKKSNRNDFTETEDNNYLDKHYDSSKNKNQLSVRSSNLHSKTANFEEIKAHLQDNINQEGENDRIDNSDAQQELDLNDNSNQDNKVIIKSNRTSIKSSNYYGTSLILTLVSSFIHASDSIYYNFFSCLLFGKSAFYLDFVSISIVFAIIHTIYSISSPISTSFLLSFCNNDERKVYYSFRLLTILMIMVNIIIPLFYTFGGGDVKNLILTSIFFILRMIINWDLLNCYNILVSMLNNYKFKTKIQDLHLYLTPLIKTFCGFCTFFISYFVLEYNAYLGFLIPLFANSLCLTSLYLSNNFEGFIISFRKKENINNL